VKDDDMTIENTNTKVSLSAKDWLAISGLALSILLAVLSAYLHHDRLLVQVSVQQDMTNQRLDKIEAKIERTVR
jgi:hypothetical protein